VETSLSNHFKQGLSQSAIIDGNPEKNRIGIEIVKKLKHNPNSRIGFQAVLIAKLDRQSLDYCLEKVEELEKKGGVKGLKVKLDSNEGRFLWISREAFLKYESAFSDFQAKKMKSNYVLADPQMQIVNERINRLLDSIHKELQL
jgi:hypothetical protein